MLKLVVVKNENPHSESFFGPLFFCLFFPHFFYARIWYGCERNFLLPVVLNLALVLRGCIVAVLENRVRQDNICSREQQIELPCEMSD